MKKLNKEFLLGLLLALSLLWPLFASSYFSHHDDVQVIRIFEMNKCFRDLQIPCRWIPDLGGSYGYPIFNYYAPLPYYFGELIYFVTGSLFVAAKTMFAFSLIGSFIFMFLVGRKLWGSWGGLLSGVFYAFAPYHALDFYVRGAMGEMWALMAFPGIFWALLRLRESTTLANTALLALFLTLLFLSHNLSVLIFTPFMVAFVLVLFLLKRQKQFLYLFFTSVCLALGLSAFYLFPAFYEKDLVHVDSITSGYFSYTEHFKGLRKTLFERSWGYGSSVREVPGGEKDGLSYQVGWIHLLALLASLYIAVIYFQREHLVDFRKRELSIIILFCFGAFLISLFMIHPLSVFVWKLIEPLKYLQFPWRFLEIIIFFVSLSAGSLVNLPYKKVTLKIVVLLVILVVTLNFGYFKPDIFRFVSEQQFLGGGNWENQIMRSIVDYLPIYAERPPANPAQERFVRLSGDGEVTSYFENSTNIKLQISAGHLTVFQLSQYYFPDWQMKIDGKIININYHNPLGLMTFAVDPGTHFVEAKFNNTIIRSISNLVSLFSLILFVVTLMLQYRKLRRFWFYIFSGFNR